MQEALNTSATVSFDCGYKKAPLSSIVITTEVSAVKILFQVWDCSQYCADVLMV